MVSNGLTERQLKLVPLFRRLARILPTRSLRDMSRRRSFPRWTRNFRRQPHPRRNVVTKAPAFRRMKELQSGSSPLPNLLALLPHPSEKQQSLQEARHIAVHVHARPVPRFARVSRRKRAGTISKPSIRSSIGGLWKPSPVSFVARHWQASSVFSEKTEPVCSPPSVQPEDVRPKPRI